MRKELNPTRSLCISYQSCKTRSGQLVKVGLIMLILLFSGTRYFQARGQKCNYEKNEIDALTELLVKRTGPAMLLRINGQPMYAKGQSIGENKYLKLLFYKYNDFSFQETREVGFVLSNEEEILLYPRQMPVDTAKMDETIEINSLLVYKLTSEQYQKLMEYPVTSFKYYLISGFITEPIKGSKQEKLKEVLRCVE